MSVLRPVFTDYLMKELENRSLNVYAPRGQGQLRLLEDVKAKLVEQTDRVFLIRMKNYAESYQGFIQALAIQTTQQIPSTQSAQLTNFAEIVSAWDERPTQQRIVIMLHDFDALLNNPHIDKAYDVTFFDHLNALKNQGHRLICVTEKPHNQSQVYVNKKVHNNSWLDLKRINLPPLTDNEIKADLFPHKFKLSPAHERHLIHAIKVHSQSYQFLDFVRQKIELNKIDDRQFKRQLKKWHQEFKQRNQSTAFKGLHSFRQWMTRIAIVTGINQFKTPFALIGSIIQKWVGK